MTLFVVLILATAFLAYANGANDNFKGVATIYGSGIMGYRAALAWATIATIAGSIASIFVATGLVDRFSGRGLVPDSLAQTPEFLLAVALGAGLTVIAASRTGFPVSTTHSLVGALLGSGVVAVGGELNVRVLGGLFLLPLFASPIIAAGSCTVGYWGVDRFLSFLKVDGRDRIRRFPVARTEDIRHSASSLHRPANRTLWSVKIGSPIDAGHILSSGIVSFARGLNDTPKIIALLFAVQGLGLHLDVMIVAIAIAAGGIIHARRVAEVISKDITPIGHGDGFAANVVTGVLVLIASRFGLPVSTTHVSVGSIFGIGLMTGHADRRVMSNIVLSWVLTLPIAAALSAAAYILVVRIW